MQIITGSTNFDNVTSNADASKHLGLLGADAVALNIGRKLEAEVGQTNNEVRIYDGEGFAQGIHFRVAPGTYDSVEIENGETGVNRTDLIVCRYQIDGEGYESTTWHTIKGAAGGAVPDYQQGSVRDESGDVIDVPFYMVQLEGLSITKVTPLFSVLMSMAEMQAGKKEKNVHTTVVKVSGKTTATLCRREQINEWFGKNYTKNDCQLRVVVYAHPTHNNIGRWCNGLYYNYQTDEYEVHFISAFNDNIRFNLTVFD